MSWHSLSKITGAYGLDQGQEARDTILVVNCGLDIYLGSSKEELWLGKLGRLVKL